MHELGVIHGRFQVLHNDHLVYLLAGKKRCEHLVIGITNPEPALTAADAADPQRSMVEANPFTYFERYRMVFAAMLWAGVKADQFSIVPLPINFPERYKFMSPWKRFFFSPFMMRGARKSWECFTISDCRRSSSGGSRLPRKDSVLPQFGN